MKPTPFWRRSGFWAALASTISVFVVLFPEWEDEIKALVVIVNAWAAFFVAAAVRPSVSVKTASDDHRAQNEMIGQLRDEVRGLRTQLDLQG